MNIKFWMQHYIDVLRDAYGPRVVCIGLQGSYGRDEATETSDIDPVLILDRLDMPTLRQYESLVAPLPHRDKLCGFVSGQAELMHWDRSDLFQLFHDTTPLYGSLDFIRPLLQPSDARRAVHLGACNLYHMACHNYLHARDSGTLAALYKSAAFTLQAKHFCETGCYVRRHSDLAAVLSPEDVAILHGRTVAADPAHFCESSERLIAWTQRLIVRFSAL